MRANDRFPVAAEEKRHAALLGRNALTAAVSIWFVAFAVVTGLALSGRISTVSYRVYAAAGRAWLDSRPLYETVTIENFQYLPQSALLMAPFAWLGSPAGDILWRALFWGSFAFGIWRVARELAPLRARECFLLASCLALLPGIGPLGNGQANLALAGLMLHAVADLIARRFWRATFVLTLGLALKPLMAVFLLLVWALYRPMTWRLPLALAPMLLVPFALKDHAYVVAQYTACLQKLRVAEAPADLYEDVRGLFAVLGWLMPHSIYLLLRMLAALLVLALGWRMRARLHEPYASVMMLALADSYLMLFNPRTQSTSYTMPASVAALLAASYALEHNRRGAALMAACVLAWTVNYHMFGFIEHWLKPLACLAFVTLLVRGAFADADADGT